MIDERSHLPSNVRTVDINGVPYAVLKVPGSLRSNTPRAYNVIDLLNLENEEELYVFHIPINIQDTVLYVEELVCLLNIIHKHLRDGPILGYHGLNRLANNCKVDGLYSSEIVDLIFYMYATAIYWRGIRR